MKTYYILYQITNNLNGKIYVGVHKTNNLDDGYMGSGKVIRSAIAKYGIENFTKDILEQFEDAAAMYAREKEVVTDEFLLREDTYNLRRGGTGGFDYLNTRYPAPHYGFRHSEATKKRIGAIAAGRRHTSESRKKMSENNWANIDPDAQRAHAKNAGIKSARVRSADTNKKLSESVTKIWADVPEVECPHCKLRGRGGIMKRWHFDRCKERK